MTVVPDLQSTAKRAIVCLDLTNLDDFCSIEDVQRLCEQAQTPFGSTAAVCVWPRFVTRAANALKNTGVKIATVVNFPNGDQPIEDVLTAAKSAQMDGADEIDLVIPYRKVLECKPSQVEEYVAETKAQIGDAPLKAILETGELKQPDLIRAAAEQALRGGADFLKTSTGKVPINATPEAAQILLTAIQTSALNAGLKVSGGIKTTEDAATYLDLCDAIMGEEWASPRNFRIGASSVLGALLATLGTVPGDPVGSRY
ncbi:MAG: deoxyribose-phosphate aldolase [Pseudomonadota bacterium]